MFRKISSTVTIAVVVFLVGGCENKDRPYKQARGQVFVGGQAAEGALVTLVPINDPDNPDRKPSGTVGPDGSFTLSTYESATRETHDGAPPGEYVILITWHPQPNRETLNQESQAIDRLAGRYKDSRTSPLRADIKDDPTELPPINLPIADSRVSRPKK
jgi:hypothetical protein